MITTDTERQKYQRVWMHDAYRAVSPGYIEKRRAWDALGCKSGETLNDYGAGPGRATAWFRDAGMDALAIDIADNALETDVPFIRACLWEMQSPPVPVADYGYCCDVMEHIPTDHVAEVFAGIAANTEKAAYFRIATRPDKMGPRLLGEPLHLTVRDGDWWISEALKAFDRVTVVYRNPRDIVFVAHPG